jgi:hypothetical protein
VRRRNRQPPHHDNKGWERRRSHSPVGHTLCQDLSPVWSHGVQKEGDQTVPAARCFSDPSLSFLPRLCDEDIQSSSFLPQIAADPMVMEFTSSFTTSVGRTLTVATVQLSDISPSASPPYILVSLESAPREDARQAADAVQLPGISPSASPPYVPVSQEWAL